jgi:hypothetical protein
VQDHQADLNQPQEAQVSEPETQALTAQRANTPAPLPSRPLSVAARPSEIVPAPFIITGNGHITTRPPIGSAKPRSRHMRIALIGLAGVMVLLFLFVTTPLTVGAANNVGNFIANARSGVYPTATPTATPKPNPYTGGYPAAGSNPGKQAVINDIQAVFGGYSPGAIAVATCESGLDPNAWNGISILGSHAEGIFQILYPSTWDNTSYAGYSPYNYDANIHAAYQIFARDNHTWREWECQP